MKKIKFNWLILLTLLSLISILFAILKGTTPIHFKQLLLSLQGRGSPLLQDILWKIRLPRALAAFVTGGLLALAGALMQVLLKNPLADPYVLGISGGAAVFTLLLLLCGCSEVGLYGGAWLGSTIAVFLLFSLQKNQALRSERLLLTGIALSSGFAAIISFILMLSADKELHGMLFWLLGDLSHAHLPWLESVILVMGFLISFGFAKELNILVTGTREACALGVPTVYLHWLLYFISALLTATAVALAGTIGFIGLIIPHLLRLIAGFDHYLLIPGCILLGGSFLTIADTLARTLLTYQEIPVGIVMAFIGIPVFLILLHKNTL